MKILILSDLHLEFAPFDPPEVEADIVVLAGDIHVGTNGVKWAQSVFPSHPVLYVCGNHELYGGAHPKTIDKLRKIAHGSNVRVIENESADIASVRFLGCTLWTDFGLHGDPVLSGTIATQTMTDFRKIRVAPEYRKFRSRDAAHLNAESVRWLREQFARPHDGPTVVITHHAPSGRSLPEQFRDDSLSPAYASPLDDLVRASRAPLWIHGHVHSQSDYFIGETRVVANPRGYPDEHIASFAPELVLTV